MQLTCAAGGQLLLLSTLHSCPVFNTLYMIPALVTLLAHTLCSWTLQWRAWARGWASARCGAAGTLGDVPKTAFGGGRCALEGGDGADGEHMRGGAWRTWESQTAETAAHGIVLWFSCMQRAVCAGLVQVAGVCRQLGLTDVTDEEMLADHSACPHVSATAPDGRRLGFVLLAPKELCCSGAEQGRSMTVLAPHARLRILAAEGIRVRHSPVPPVLLLLLLTAAGWDCACAAKEAQLFQSQAQQVRSMAVQAQPASLRILCAEGTWRAAAHVRYPGQVACQVAHVTSNCAGLEHALILCKHACHCLPASRWPKARAH